jgi:hypothetical protein
MSSTGAKFPRRLLASGLGPTRRGKAGGPRSCHLASRLSTSSKGPVGTSLGGGVGRDSQPPLKTGLNLSAGTPTFHSKAGQILPAPVGLRRPVVAWRPLGAEPRGRDRTRHRLEAICRLERADEHGATPESVGRAVLTSMRSGDRDRPDHNVSTPSNVCRQGARREGSVPASDSSAVLVLLQSDRDVAQAGALSTRSAFLRGSPGFMPPLPAALSRQRCNGGARARHLERHAGSLVAHKGWPRWAN